MLTKTPNIVNSLDNFCLDGSTVGFWPTTYIDITQQEPNRTIFGGG